MHCFLHLPLFRSTSALVLLCCCAAVLLCCFISPDLWTPPPDGLFGAGEGASRLGAAVTENQGLKETRENLL